jgi:hypothetical protein
MVPPAISIVCSTSDMNTKTPTNNSNGQSSSDRCHGLVLVPRRNGQRLLAPRQRHQRHQRQQHVGCIPLPSLSSSLSSSSSKTETHTMSMILGRHELLPCLYQACGCDETSVDNRVTTPTTTTISGSTTTTTMISSQNKCSECQAVNSWALHAVSRTLFRIQLPSSSCTTTNNNNNNNPSQQQPIKLRLQVRGEYATLSIDSKPLAVPVYDDDDDDDDINVKEDGNGWSKTHYEIRRGTTLTIQPRKGTGRLDFEVVAMSELFPMDNDAINEEDEDEDEDGLSISLLEEEEEEEEKESHHATKTGSQSVATTTTKTKSPWPAAAKDATAGFVRAEQKSFVPSNQPSKRNDTDEDRERRRSRKRQQPTIVRKDITTQSAPLFSSPGISVIVGSGERTTSPINRQPSSNNDLPAAGNNNKEQEEKAKLSSPSSTIPPLCTTTFDKTTTTTTTTSTTTTIAKPQEDYQCRAVPPRNPQLNNNSSSSSSKNSSNHSSSSPSLLRIYICPLGQDLPMFRRKLLTQKAIRMGATIVDGDDYAVASYWIISDLVPSLSPVAGTLGLSEEALVEHLESVSSRFFCIHF